MCPQESGTYWFGLRGSRGSMTFDGKPWSVDRRPTVARAADAGACASRRARARDRGRVTSSTSATPRSGLGWRPPSEGTPFDAAVAAARAADVVVFVGGLTAEVEGEEMRVSYPGFRGGDRTDIELPGVAAEDARGAAGDGQAGRARPDDGLGARGPVGAGEPARDRPRVVPRGSRAATPWRTCSSATSAPAAGCR